MDTVSIENTSIPKFIKLKQDKTKYFLDKTETLINNINSLIDKKDILTEQQYDKDMTILENLHKSMNDTNRSMEQTNKVLVKSVNEYTNFMTDEMEKYLKKIENTQKMLNKKKTSKSLASLSVAVLSNEGVKADDLPEITREPFTRHSRTGGKRKTKRRRR
jgi:hypothetical protein